MRPIRTLSRVRGAALVSMLIVVVLLVLLSVAVTRVAHGDFKRARDKREALAAREAADLAAHLVQRDWATFAADSVRVGALLPDVNWSSAYARAVARTMRTSGISFWTVAQGQSGDSSQRTLSRALVNVAWRLAVPDVDVIAALTVRDSVTLSGGARVVGIDTSLASWGTCPQSASFAPPLGAAIALPDTMRVCDGGCGSAKTGGRLLGTPALLADPGASNTARYATFGAEDWSTLTAHATIVVPPGGVVSPAPMLAGASCDRSTPTNWGDPAGTFAPCANYAPLIWARGDVEIRGGVGQGLLLVDGDVTLSGGALFAGVVIARDDLVGLGTGGTVLGAALAGDALAGTGDHTRLDGSTLVQSSSCAVARALLGSARLQRVRERSWAELR